MTTESLNLFVVDDDEAVHRSLGMLFLSRGHAVQTFAGGEAFLATANLHDGGCVILDLRMGSMSGLEVFDELRSRASALAVVFLSGNGDIAVAVEAVQKGAFGWLEKPCADERLMEKVQQALAWSSQQCTRLCARRAAAALWQKLTPREQQVSRLVAVGSPNKVIARLLAPIALRTIENHRANIFAKLRLLNSNELDRFLRDHAL